MATDTKKIFASDCKILAIPIWRAGEEDKEPYANLMGIAGYFQYYEDILWPSYGGSLLLLDVSLNLISTMPIRGFEKVVVKVEMNGITYDYNFRVWSVTNRVVLERRQSYTLNLISEEGLVNEGLRVNNVRKGQVSAVVQKLMKEFFKADMFITGTDENNVDGGTWWENYHGIIDKTANSIKVLPTKKTPFALIRSIQTKTIPDEIPTADEIAFNNSGIVLENQYNEDERREMGLITDENLLEASHVGNDVDKAGKTAGYYFFQTRKGFNFRSIDTLGGGEPVNRETPFRWSPGRKDGNDSEYKIQEIQYGEEINILKKMREGAYSSLICFFNINTGKYTERLYSIKDTWDEMTHIGKDTNLPSGLATLSTRPSRIMSTVINHENWYMGEGIADSTDEKSDGTFDYPDEQMNYLSQSYARAGIMMINQLTISVTGHLELVAGDLVEVRTPNQKDDKARDENPWDPQYSGTYLIKKLNHQFDISHQTVYTVLELIRDSCGIKYPDEQTN